MHDLGITKRDNCCEGTARSFPVKQSARLQSFANEGVSALASEGALPSVWPLPPFYEEWLDDTPGRPPEYL
jgi:hypothetical protein